MLLTMEEIKAQLRLDEDFDTDDRHLQLLACAAQKPDGNVSEPKLYAPDETIPDSDPDGLHLPDDIRLGMLMLINHFYEKPLVGYGSGETRHAREFWLACRPVQVLSAMKIRQAQTSATYILPDPGELNKRVLIRLRVDMPADNFGVEPQYQLRSGHGRRLSRPVPPHGRKPRRPGTPSPITSPFVTAGDHR